MKAFEKYRASRPDYKCMIHDCEKCHQDAELIWRAAIQHLGERIGKRVLVANTLPYLRKHIERIVTEELEAD